MSNAPGTRSSRLPVAIVFGLAAIASAAAATAPQPIVGPPIAMGETGAAVADPLVPVPAETPCVVTLYTAGSTTGTFDDYANTADTAPDAPRL